MKSSLTQIHSFFVCPKFMDATLDIAKGLTGIGSYVVVFAKRCVFTVCQPETLFCLQMIGNVLYWHGITK